MRKQNLLFALLTLALAALLTPSFAGACTAPDPQPPTVWVDNHGTCCFDDGTCITLLWVKFHNFTTFPSNPGTFCACGLTKVKGITSIRGAMVTDATTGELIKAFDFSGNSGVSTSASRVLVGDDVQGFLAKIGSDIPAGRKVDIAFEVTVDRGTNPDEVVEALTNAGGATLVTAEADEAGRFVGHIGRWPATDHTPIGTNSDSSNE